MVLHDRHRPPPPPHAVAFAYPGFFVLKIPNPDTRRFDADQSAQRITQLRSVVSIGVALEFRAASPRRVALAVLSRIALSRESAIELGLANTGAEHHDLPGAVRIQCDAGQRTGAGELHDVTLAFRYRNAKRPPGGSPGRRAARP